MGSRVAHCPLSGEVVSARLATLPCLHRRIKPTSSAGVGRLDSGVTKGVVGFIRPLGKAPRVGQHCSLASPRVPSSIAVRGLDRFRYTPLDPFFPRGQHSVRSVKGQPLPSPSTPPRPSSSWIRHSQPSMPRDRSKTLRGRDRLQLISGSAAGERHPTNASRQEKVFETWWLPIRCRRRSRIGEHWHARGRSPRKRGGRVCG